MFRVVWCVARHQTDGRAHTVKGESAFVVFGPSEVGEREERRSDFCLSCVCILFWTFGTWGFLGT